MRSAPIFILTFLIALNSAREINDKTLNFIKDYEKWRSCAYFDAVGKLTIGYGHLIKPDENFTSDSCITEEQGLQLLKNDLLTSSNCIERIVHVPLTDNQFGALVSWTFNVGCGAATNSTLVSKLNAGILENDICEQLRRWNKGNGKILAGLVRRREDECSLFNSHGDNPIDRANITCEIWHGNVCMSNYHNTKGISCFYKCQFTDKSHTDCQPYYLGYRNVFC